MMSSQRLGREKHETYREYGKSRNPLFLRKSRPDRFSNVIDRCKAVKTNSGQSEKVMFRFICHSMWLELTKSSVNPPQKVFV
jgi:hypothetical protein